MSQALTLQGPLGLIAPPTIGIECPAFAGSLGALVRGVIRSQVDVAGVPLTAVARAYWEHLTRADTVDVDEAANALLILSYLIERKAHGMLPKPPPVEEEMDCWDGPTIAALEPGISEMRRRFEARSGIFFRHAAADLEMPLDLGEVTAVDLARTLQRVLERVPPEPEVLLSRPRRSLTEQMRVVVGRLLDIPRTLLELIVGPVNRVEALWTFLAVLELIRLGKVLAVTEDEQLGFVRVTPA